MLTLLLSFCCLLLALLLFYLSGKWLFSSLKIYFSNFSAQLFFSTLSGLTAFTIGTALYFTRGRSIFIVLLLFLGLLYFFTRTKNSKEGRAYKLNLKLDFKERILPLLLSLVLLFCWFARLILDAHLELSFPSNPETILYAQFAKTIAHTGIESTFGIGYLPIDFPKSLSPYHYFDLWLSAGISQLTGLTTLQSIHFFTLPCLNFLNILGICALLEQFQKWKFYFPFLAFLSLFFSACYFFPKAEEFGQYNFDYLEPLLGLYGEKLSFAFTILLAAAFLFLQAQTFFGMLLLLLLPLLFPSLLFPIFIALPFYSFICFHRKSIDKLDLLKILAFEGLMLLSYFLFYNSWGSNSFSLESASDYKGLNLSSFKMIVAESFYRSWYKPLRTALFYLPFLLLLIWERKNLKSQKINSLIQLAIFVFIGALLSWSLLYKLPEAWQIYTNSLLLIHLVILLSFFALQSAPNNGIRSTFVRMSFISLLLFSSYFSFQSYENAKRKDAYSPDFLHQVNAILSSEKNNFVVAYLKNGEEYMSMSELSTGGLVGAYLQLQAHFYGMINLGFFEQLKDSKHTSNKKRVFMNQNFYGFVQKEIREKRFKNLEQSQLTFLKENSISYLAVSAKASVPTEITKICRKQIVDNLSGEKFLVLDKSFIFK